MLFVMYNACKDKCGNNLFITIGIKNKVKLPRTKAVELFSNFVTVLP